MVVWVCRGDGAAANKQRDEQLAGQPDAAKVSSNQRLLPDGVMVCMPAAVMVCIPAVAKVQLMQ